MSILPLVLEDKDNPNFAVCLEVRKEEEDVKITIKSSWGVPRGVEEVYVYLNQQSARRLALEILERFQISPEEERRVVEQY